jgi:glycosyltransferase involved in cell wall biosynthesis
MSNGNGKIRVLQVHNRYSPGWGGEDTVVEQEARLLKERGHTVEQFQVSSASLKQASALRQIVSVPEILWSCGSYKKIREVITRFAPDVVHAHNTFPLLSPSVFWAARRAGVPTVLTLHNFRHTCANAVLLRDDRPCEDCVGRFPWPALRYRCYANSIARTAVVVAMNILHRMLETYTQKIDVLIALNDFNRQIFVRSGLPNAKLRVKPNFVPTYALANTPRLADVLFVGSLSRHKGVHLLLEAWRRTSPGSYQLLIVGDGPEREQLMAQFADVPGVNWCGCLTHSEVLERMATSRILVLPTLAYENCPMVILEAFSVATPVIVPNHGSLRTFVRHRQEGLIFRAGDPDALTEALREAIHASEEVWLGWSQQAKRAHAQDYSEAVNYESLLSIYQRIIQERAASRTASRPVRGGKGRRPSQSTSETVSASPKDN